MVCCNVIMEFMAIDTCDCGHWDGRFVLLCLYSNLFLGGALWIPILGLWMYIVDGVWWSFLKLGDCLWVALGSF